MMKFQNVGYLVLLLFSAACRSDEHKQPTASSTPQVTDEGKKIVFPSMENIGFFKTETIGDSVLDAEIVAPAKVAATVLPSQEGASQNIILFEDPELGSTYTQLIQHLININHISGITIKQRKVELERLQDLQKHGSATGRDVLEAQAALSVEEANLANEKAAILEHESKLKAAGFDPKAMRSAAAGTAYVICDIPENQIEKIMEETTCQIEFTSFPGEKFTGKIEDIADMIDNITRMIKLRVQLTNKDRKLKAGMFGNVMFKLKANNALSVNKTAIITVQGKDYVFVKTSANSFERKTVSTAAQINDRIVILDGINQGDSVAVKGVIQLKGLSFGY